MSAYMRYKWSASSLLTSAYTQLFTWNNLPEKKILAFIIFNDLEKNWQMTLTLLQTDEADEEMISLCGLGSYFFSPGVTISGTHPAYLQSSSSQETQFWPPIGWDRSHDLNTGLWLVSQYHQGQIQRKMCLRDFNAHEIPSFCILHILGFMRVIYAEAACLLVAACFCISHCIS